MTKNPEGFANPLAAAAASLMKLEDATAPPDRRTVEQALAAQAMRIGQNDLSGMEAMLSHQAQMLHRIFAHSLEKYAGVEAPETSRLYSNIALKAQSYCRLTMNAITHIKKTEERTIKRDNEATLKLQNTLLGKTAHASMDSRGTPASGTHDPWLATMETCHRP